MSKLRLWQDVQSQVPQCRLHSRLMVHAPSSGAAKLGALSKMPIPLRQ